MRATLQAIAEWLLERYNGRLRTVYLKYKAGGGGVGFEDSEEEEEGQEQEGQSSAGPRQSRQRQAPGKQQQGQRGRVVAGEPPVAGQPTVFVENGVRFQVSDSKVALMACKQLLLQSLQLR
jgi:hypothetical protein